MNLLDRILLVLASLCLSAIFVIFFSGELSSNYSSKKLSSTKSEKKSSKDKMVIYGQEIEKAINQYFRTLKENPEIDEEEKRLVNDIIFESNKIQKLTKKIELSEPKKSKNNLFINHVVEKGESLWRISNKYNVPLYTIISANPKKTNQVIHQGDILSVPTKKGIVYKVKKGDSLSKIAKIYKISTQNIKKINKLTSSRIGLGKNLFLPDAKPLPVIKYTYQNKFIWPVRGRVTSRYGWRIHPISKNRHFHRGVDISAKRGTNIRAIAKGVVIYSDKSGGYGRLVILRHSQNYLSAYAHCSRIYVKKGKVVRRGQRIAKVGSSGLSTGSHLHFEVKHYHKNTNPIIALRKKIKIPIS